MRNVAVVFDGLAQIFCAAAIELFCGRVMRYVIKRRVSRVFL